jgi:hypothetical protein
MRAEAERLKNPVTTPSGWHYLWSIGDSGIFDAGQGARGEPIIRCRVHDDASILQRPVHLQFDRSARREDTVRNHDYLSVAVEFDNGQDLTYMWSGALASESSFRCPIPRWSGRETHMVVRSGTERLGEWVNEERNVWDDYGRAIGTPPAGIVAVWLIAVGIFALGVIFFVRYVQFDSHLPIQLSLSPKDQLSAARVSQGAAYLTLKALRQNLTFLPFGANYGLSPQKTQKNGRASRRHIKSSFPISNHGGKSCHFWLIAHFRTVSLRRSTRIRSSANRRSGLMDRSCSKSGPICCG